LNTEAAKNEEPAGWCDGYARVQERVRLIDTEEAENTERMSHRDTKTQRISVSRCLRG